VFATELARLSDYLLNRLLHQIARAAHLQQICWFSFLADRHTRRQATADLPAAFNKPPRSPPVPRGLPRDSPCRRKAAGEIAARWRCTVAAARKTSQQRATVWRTVAVEADGRAPISN
jgi:hypothetical protein